MATSREIINDLRAQARALAGRHMDGSTMHGVCRSLRRGADELDRLMDELSLLRAFAEVPEDQ